MSARSPRVVVVTRPTELEALVARHGTRGQAAFFLEQRGRAIAEVEQRHHRQESALAAVLAAIPQRWRRTRLDRAALDRFLFEPDDLVVVVGQDGLVANVAKYLREQPVVGVNPDPARHDGVLVPHPPEAAGDHLVAAAAGRSKIQARVMARATLDDGQQLVALNEIFVGHRSHQSARYRLGFGEREEQQSSSGLIVTTGTGATGWARSIERQRPRAPALPGPTDARLVFFVREPFPSVATGTDLEQGVLPAGRQLEIVSEMNEGGTVFGDGIEADHLELGWGVRVRVEVAPQRLHLVVG
jgi:NAD kinase